MSTALAATRLAARAILPGAVRRALAHSWHAFESRALPDRVYFEKAILPWLRRGDGQTLFVGCRAYTSHYERLFRKRGMTFWSMDIDPAAAAFGAWGGRHRTADVTEPFDGLFPLSFDAIVLNGVIGWGVDSDEAILRCLRNIAAAAKKDAPIVIGWNDDRSGDPLDVAGADRLMRRIPGPTGRSRVGFAGSTHIYDFAQKL